MQIPKALARDLRRLFNSNRYEIAPNGFYFPAVRAGAYGVMELQINDGPVEAHPNTFTTEGFNHMLATEFNDGAKVSTWYVSLWSLNATPAITWTAANFNANATEFTNYDEATRVAYVEAAPASGSVTNSASKATFTIATGGGSVWGGALHSVATKSASTGVLAAAAKFSALKTLVATDQINLGYTLTLTAA
jgi:hypothetical protein